MSFVHLSLHTEFSLVDGLIRIKPLFERLKEQQVTAVALTDLGNAFGAIKFYQAALKAGIKPIFGADLLLRTDDGEVGRITALAQNYTGYLNLSKLLSKGYIEKQIRGIPHITPEWLREYNEGLILILSKESHFGQALIHHNPESAEKVLHGLYSEYLDNRLYLGVKRLNQEGDDLFIHEAVLFSERLGLPLVAHNDVRFMDKSDFEAHEVRTCIQSGNILSDPNRPKNYSPEQYLKSPEEMITLFEDLPEAIENANELAKRCTVTLQLDVPQLPHLETPDGVTMEEYFRKASKEGLIAHIGEPNEENREYWERLERELNVIIEMGFPDYFLIVADFIQWSKQNNIPVGPGRGSGAGSLVAWALGITNIDPLLYDLLFERFLNPERVSMPDFDIDFCMEGRDRVIDYVADKYGRDAVSQIATHGTMAAKAVVRDVGRALGQPYGFVDRIARLIPFEIGMTLEKAMQQEPDLYDLYHKDEEVAELIDLAKQLEGLTKSVGRHAGGVVIAPTLLTDFSPLYCEEGTTALVTQYDKDDIEAAGLVKFDFLGLRTLTIIDWALKNIKKSRNIELDIEAISLEDEATFALLKSCKTTAVFQLESHGMKDLLNRLQPDTFEDIIALVALFRPGPLESGMVDDFINRKHGLEEVEYPFPELEDVLAPTYGVIVYQEQVMQISQIIGNYSLGGADLLRRAMGAKLPEVMAEQRALFMEGAKELGFDAEKAGNLFDLMEKFAGYGFNKSHSAAYALLSYQTAYLKAHYPAEFMAAVLSADLDHTDKLVIFINECRAMGLTIRRPNINESLYQFSVNEKGELVYGLGGLKGYGKAAALQLIEERNINGPYRDLFDFCRRIDTSKTTRRAIEILINAGAFDALESSITSIFDRAAYRASLIATLPEAMQLAQQHHHNQNSGQDDLFGLFADEEADKSLSHSLTKAPAYTRMELLQKELDTLGFYYTAHPTEQYQKEFRSIITHTLQELLTLPEPEFKQYSTKGREPDTLIAGFVTDLYSRITRKGNKMNFAVIEDHTARYELLYYDEQVEALGEAIEAGTILFAHGHQMWDEYNGAMGIRVSSLHTLDHIRLERGKYLYLTNRTAITPDHLQKLMALINQHSDANEGLPLLFRYQVEEGSVVLQLSNRDRLRPSFLFSEEFESHFSSNFYAEYRYQ